MPRTYQFRWWRRWWSPSQKQRQFFCILRTHLYATNLSICWQLFNSGGGGDDGASRQKQRQCVCHELIYMSQTHSYVTNSSVCHTNSSVCITNSSIQVVEEMMELLDKSNGNLFSVMTNPKFQKLAQVFPEYVYIHCVYIVYDTLYIEYPYIHIFFVYILSMTLQTRCNTLQHTATHCNMSRYHRQYNIYTMNNTYTLHIFIVYMLCMILCIHVYRVS